MFSATDAALEGFRVAGRHPFLVMFWTLAYTFATLILVLALLVAIAPSLLPVLMAGPGALESRQPDDLFNPIGFAVAFPVFFVAIVFMAAMTVTTVYRAVLRPRPRGFGYLVVGGDEWRQILLMLLLVAVSGLAVAGAIALVATTVNVTPQAWKALVGVATGIACAVLLVWVSVRLSLASAQTFAERRVTLFGSWSLTRGRFWSLLGMWILAAVLSVLVSMVATALSYLPLLLAPGGLGLLAKGAWHAWPDSGTSTAVVVAFVLNGFLQMVGAILQIVVSTVPGAAAYDQLKPSPAG